MKRIFVAFALLFAAVVPAFAFTAPANAATTGCSTKVETWGRNATFTAIGTFGLPGEGELRLVGNVVYERCFNGDRVNTIQPKKLNFCYTWVSERWYFPAFDGVKFNAYIWDDNEDTNPPTIKVGDDNSVQNCRTQSVDSPLLEMDQSPGWSLTSFIVFSGQPDDEYIFKVNGNPWRYFHPDEDLTLS